MRKSHLEVMFKQLVRATGLEIPVEEYKFHPTRKWRFDFAWERYKIAVELEGAIWTNGRHTRGSGFTADCEKYNEAAVMGWTVLRYTSGTIGQSVDDLKRLFNICGVKTKG